MKSVIGTIRHRLRSLGQSRQVKQEIDEELQFHLEQRTAANIAAGMSPAQAAREARKRFGNFQIVREECRELRRASVGDALWQDLAFGARMLRKNPGFTAVVTLTLALGIGANTAIFSVINGVLLRPLPYPDSERLVTVCERSIKQGFPQITVRPAVLEDWFEHNSVFEQLGGQIYESLNLTGIETPEHLHAARTALNYFAALGVQPMLGRLYAEGVNARPPLEAVLSYGLWKRDFGGDRSVLGRSITLSGVDYTVAGVMPPQFKIYQSSIFGLPTGEVQPQLRVPWYGQMDDRTNHYFQVFGRLKPGVALAQAETEVSGIARRFNSDSPGRLDWDAVIVPLQEEIAGGSRQVLMLLLGAVGLVLLISCVNVVNLLLARLAVRSREFAVRSVLGASRLRLVRQLLVENAILTVLGAGLGVLLAGWSLAGLKALQPGGVPRLDEIHLDAHVLWFTLAVSVAAGVTLSLAPVLFASRIDLAEHLKETGERGTSEGVHRHRLRRSLVVIQVALAVILLTGAGLMANSFVRLIRVNPGFNPGHLVSFDFSLSYNDYTDDTKRLEFVRRLRERVQAQPGVESAATVRGLPFGTMLNSLVGIQIEGLLHPDPTERMTVAWRMVSPNYFQAMGVPLIMGRQFSQDRDTPNTPPVLIVNEAFVRKHLPGKNPVGQRLRLPPVGTNWEEIVGVCADIKLTGLDVAPPPEVYESNSQKGDWMFSLVVRSTLPPRQIEKYVRDASGAEDPGVPPFNVRTMDQAIGESAASRQFAMLLAVLFAGLALILTVVGIYGVVSYGVSQRTREIGIRMALGASRDSVLRLILWQGMTPVMIGAALGVAGSFLLARLIATQLYGVTPNDPATLAAVVLLLTVVALVACYLPAHRGTKIDPMTALRHE